MRPEIADTVKGKLHIDRRRLVGYVAGIAAILLAVIRSVQGGGMLEGIDSASDWANLVGLAIEQ